MVPSRPVISAERLGVHEGSTLKLVSRVPSRARASTVVGLARLGG